jgi:chromate transport protein ChrA
MAGVAGPMLTRSRASGARFLTGLAAGGVTAGLVLAVPVYLVGHLAGSVLPVWVRLGLLVLMAAAFGLADLAGRTPHIWRQVPQRFVRSLEPGTLGLVWGFDLGLLVTTQKTSSLLWLSLAALTLLDPGLAPVALVTFSLVATAGILTWSLTPWATRLERRKDRTWVRRTRWATGTTMLATGLGTILTAMLG